MMQSPVTGTSLMVRVADALALSGDDRLWFLKACEAASRVERDVDLAREGEQAAHIHFVVSGFAVRYRLTTDGYQQNFGFIIPGNFCDLHMALLDRNDHSIRTLSPCLVTALPRKFLVDAAARSEGLMRAFWWCSLLNESILREWIVNLAQKSAEERVAHLFCELHARLESAGLVQPDNSFLLPLTQRDLANTVGLSIVHVNRSLKALREAGLLLFRQSEVQIADLNRLRARARFNPSYLHLGSSPR